MTADVKRRPGGNGTAQETTGGYVAPDRTPPCRLCPLCECGYDQCRADPFTRAVAGALRGGRRG